MADAVKIKKAPDRAVDSLKVARRTNAVACFDCTWKNPDWAISDKNERRYESTYCWMTIDEVGVTSKKDPWEVQIRNNLKSTSAVLNMNDFTTHSKKKLNRKSFYPFKSKPKVSSVRVKLQGANSIGFGPAVTNTYKFELPRAPKISWSYNKTNGRATVTVETNAGRDKYDRYDTMIAVTVLKPNGKTTTIRKWAATTSTKWTATYDTGNYGTLSAGKKFVFTCKAYSRGLRGDNPSKAKATTKSLTVGMPTATTISSITASSKKTTGRITVKIKKVGAFAQELQLQRRHGEDGSWEDVEGGVDNGKAVALYDSVGMADPIDGQKIYYRILTRANGYVTASEHLWAKAIYTAAPTPASIKCGIVSLTPGDDGKSAKVVVGWNAADTTGTEVTWSTDPYAWESTSQPSSFIATWKDSKSQDSKWTYTMTLYVGGLTEGETYYVRARRFSELESGTIYSDYAQSSAVTPATQITNVSISAPAAVSRGEAIPVYWTFDGSAVQTGYTIQDSNGRAVAAGSGSIGSASISPDMYGEDESIIFRVIVTSKGEPAQSEYVTVSISAPPTCEIYAPSTIGAQPATFTVYSDQDVVRVLAKCISDGITVSEPDGSRYQIAGDVVWTDAVTPTDWREVSWSTTALYKALLQRKDDAQAALNAAQDAMKGLSPGTEEYADAEAEVTNAQNDVDAIQASIDAHVGTVNEATVSMAGNVDLLDTCNYVIEASVVNSETGLSSGTDSSKTSVLWEHQAPEPNEDMEVVVNEEERTASISLIAPNGASASDVYDIYRQTRDGYELVRASVPVNAKVTDMYPAFGDDMAYRICSRTIDGDIAFSDFFYSMPEKVLRFDWQESSLELKYNLEYSDDSSKDFEARHHYGESKAAGYWNGSVSATGSYGAVVIKAFDTEAVSAMRELANYGGAVFCRTPRGDAFQCNVNVSESDSQRSMLETVSFSITKVALTEEFMVSTDRVEVPE